MGEVSLGTVYDINKNLMKNEKKLSSPALTNKLKKVTQFFKEGQMYYMLLCHEMRDYTIFRIIDSQSSAEKATQELKECLLNRGEVLSLDKEENGECKRLLCVDRKESCSAPRAYLYFFLFE